MGQLGDLPKDARRLIKEGKAVLISDLDSEQLSKYMDARDERLVKDRYYKTIIGEANLVVVGVETTRAERQEMNFPNFMLDIKLKDVLRL